ncbi:ubiquinol-cytochrome c reductase iron-sulfur subunit [Gelidibacter sp.]|uniref:QcrA and Rieske domain-containing protein n=1 Tax=Gelidibacter sp. TaxID=2018083 RepID=UPI002C20DCF1|nr:Rieske 2Fe-2S domain-containing protein [Gelidibacter sp.]HUH29687.1 Rieske 2Fe-2S domain-containing protein [Gelidibacter sp.]
MNRKKFLKTCGVVLVGLPFASTLLTSCESIYYATSSIKNNSLIVPLSEFEIVKKNTTTYRTFVLVKTSTEDFPICLYKSGANDYTAALMKCTHRGCELNVGGGIYSCPCHGSEFDTKGGVLEGPADQDLKTYKTTIQNENIYIELS